jgi:hypothetical protein
MMFAMLGYRKRSFRRAHELLEKLRANADNPAVLRSLQALLLGELVRTERKIRELKGQLKGIQSSGGASAAKKSSYLQNRIARVRDVAYLWRSFGDAIAFLYMDKHALKQTYFNADNPNIKAGAGFISDKEGLIHEIALVEAALQQNVPALLVDITNTLRHGDVCLMGGPDPELIEVKASAGLDRRGRRQRRAIDNLRNFFETDRAENLRGFSNVRRTAYAGPKESHADELNACIAEARKTGTSVKHPEAGVIFIAVTADGDLESALHQVTFKKAWEFNLNELKIQHAWSPYVPFTLSIRDHNDLWAFARGEVYVLIIIDPENFLTIAKHCGCEAELDMNDPDHMLRVNFPGSIAAGVSAQLLARIGIEFVSPKWLISSLIEMMKQQYEADDTKAAAN